MDNICQQTIYIIKRPILLAIKCNLQKRESFIASKDILVLCQVTGKFSYVRSSVPK